MLRQNQPQQEFREGEKNVGGVKAGAGVKIGVKSVVGVMDLIPMGNLNLADHPLK
jgi:hypothetical protein